MLYRFTSRRRFLLGAVIAVTAPLSLRYASAPAYAQDLPKLPVDNPQAKALAYAEDASKVAHASFKAGSNCANCQFLQGDKGDQRPCQLFPGFSVATAGWCAAWAKKA